MVCITFQFYSWYLYPDKDKDYGRTVSSAEFVESVNDVRLLASTLHTRSNPNIFLCRTPSLSSMDSPRSVSALGVYGVVMTLSIELASSGMARMLGRRS
jgi:hypothetical protein